MSDSGERPPRIDLTNFDSEEFAELDFVLTSPRSLEACRLVGVAPVQLLYCRLQEFAAARGHAESTTQLLEAFDKHETWRKRLLQQARQERLLLLRESGEDAEWSGLQVRQVAVQDTGVPSPEPVRDRSCALEVPKHTVAVQTQRDVEAGAGRAEERPSDARVSAKSCEQPEPLREMDTAETLRHDQTVPTLRSSQRTSILRSEQTEATQRPDQTVPNLRNDQNASTQRSDQKVPTQRSDQKVPTLRSDQKVPTLRSDQKVPTQRSDQKVSTQRSDQKVPTQRPDQKVPTQRSDQKVSTQRPDQKASTLQTQNHLRKTSTQSQRSSVPPGRVQASSVQPKRGKRPSETPPRTKPLSVQSNGVHHSPAQSTSVQQSPIKIKDVQPLAVQPLNAQQSPVPHREPQTPVDVSDSSGHSSAAQEVSREGDTQPKLVVEQGMRMCHYDTGGDSAATFGVADFVSKKDQAVQTERLKGLAELMNEVEKVANLDEFGDFDDFSGFKEFEDSPELSSLAAEVTMRQSHQQQQQPNIVHTAEDRQQQQHCQQQQQHCQQQQQQQEQQEETEEEDAAENRPSSQRRPSCIEEVENHRRMAELRECLEFDIDSFKEELRRLRQLAETSAEEANLRSSRQLVTLAPAQRSLLGRIRIGARV